LFDTFPKVATFIFGLGSEEQAIAILTKLFVVEGHRFSYEFTQLAVYQGKIVGMFIGYPGRMVGRLDRRLGMLMMRQYRLRGKLALILRAYPMVFIQEAARNEYLLSNLAVRKRMRGQGIGAILLQQVEETAAQAGLDRVSLMVSITNQDARRFYERHGYSVKAIHLESNQRVPFLGAGYHRMLKAMSV
jgi:ribosomal protein S18 acetylase RimI-like enzyme